MFKTWLCANLGIAYVICALVLLGIAAFFLSFQIEDGGTGSWFLALIAIGFVSFVFVFACEPQIGPIISVVVLFGFYFLFVYLLKHPDDGGEIPEKSIYMANIIVISLSVCSAIPAFFVARYANLHFYDVVSRRWLYRNSAKDVFESTWKYTFNRFCMAFLVAFCLFIDIAIIIILTIAEYGDGLSSIIN